MAEALIRKAFVNTSGSYTEYDMYICPSISSSETMTSGYSSNTYTWLYVSAIYSSSITTYGTPSLIAFAGYLDGVPYSSSTTTTTLYSYSGFTFIPISTTSDTVTASSVILLSDGMMYKLGVSVNPSDYNIYWVKYYKPNESSGYNIKTSAVGSIIYFI